MIVAATASSWWVHGEAAAEGNPNSAQDEFGQSLTVETSAEQGPASDEDTAPSDAPGPQVDSAPAVDPEPWEFRRVHWFPPRLYAGGIFAVPRASYSDSRGVGFGGDLRYYFTWPDCDRSTPVSEIELDGRLTFKRQGELSLGATFHTSPKFHFKAKVEHDALVERYYGIGPDTPDSAEEKYKPQDTRAYLECFRTVVGRLRFGARAEVRRFLLLDREDEGALASAPPRGATKGVTSGAGWIFDWDRRRGNAHAMSGVYVQGFGLFFDELFGSDFDFNNYHLDARGYIPAGNERQVAVQGFLYAAKGRPPFWHMAELGGRAHTRGYRRGRYRDRVLASGQAEWRQHLFWRVGWAGFVGLAGVSDTVSDLRIDSVRPSYGGGPRLRLGDATKQLYARFDVGLGGEVIRYYFSLGEAF